MRLIDADEFFENYPELAIEPYINVPTVEFHYKPKRMKIDKDGNVEFEYTPQGEYEEGTQGHYCSICYEIDYSYYDHNYCPYCGAKMKGGKEE
jgi:hypothetical protein